MFPTPQAPVRPTLFALALVLAVLACRSPTNNFPPEPATGGTAGGTDPDRPGGAGGAGGKGSGGAGGSGGGAGGAGGTIDGPGPNEAGPIDVPPAPACNAGETRCAATGEPTVEICTATGTWTVRQKCEAICAAGACAGKCRPGDKQCGSDQRPQTCTPEGEWGTDEACPFVCAGKGECGGECKPGAKRCGDAPNSLVPYTCDENGKWAAATQPCLNVCSSGTCAGTCMPGQRRCGANQVPELCGPMGTWEPEPACPFVCVGAGQCTGECKPGAKRCQGVIPLTCDRNGRWSSGNACQYVCSGGNCTGTCSPDMRRCNPNGRAVQVCRKDGSGWSDETTCMFGCDAATRACNQCQPRTETCNNADDDCDGAIDDNVTESCSNRCGATGTRRCRAGVWDNSGCPATNIQCCSNADCPACNTCAAGRCTAVTTTTAPGCDQGATCDGSAGGARRTADQCMKGMCRKGTAERCAQGCETDECRISLVGTWDDHTGNTIAIMQNGATLQLDYATGPQADWNIPGRLTGRRAVRGDWNAGCCTGTVSDDGRRITWSNGGIWDR